MSIDICNIIALNALEYNSRNESIFDGIIDLAFDPLHTYIVKRQEPAKEFKDDHAVKLLWIYLCSWANIRNICSKSFDDWKKIGKEILKILNNYSDFLYKISNENPEPEKILSLLEQNEIANKLEALFNELNNVEGLGPTSISKTLFLFSAGRLPIMDSNILKCLDIKVNNGRDYIVALKTLLKLAKNCHNTLQPVHERLKNRDNYSEPRRSIIKTMDEGLWRYLIKTKEDVEAQKGFCESVKRVIQ